MKGSDGDPYLIGEETRTRIDEWIAAYPEGRQQSAVIPALWLVQKEAGGWLPRPAIAAIADLLGMPPIRVEEIVSFYSMFMTRPVGEFFIQLCGTTPCCLCGSKDLAAVCERRIGPEGQCSDDGRMSWMEVECLGACVNAPLVQINDTYHERLDADTFNALLDDLEAHGASRRGIVAASIPVSAPLSEPILYDGSRARALAIPNTKKPRV